MEISDVVSNVKVFGLEDSIKASKYPMSVNLDELTEEMTPTQIRLAQSEPNSGNDNWLNGIVVQFDLTFTNKAWVEAERYHFLDFVSSQSTMHRITKFDLDKAYIEYVDPRIVEIMKERVARYNAVLEVLNNYRSKKEKTDEINRLIEKGEELSKRRYLEVLYSNPCGFRLTARMTTNYRQLKTIYKQRRGHRLPEWRLFCRWIETLPHSELITGISYEI